MQRHIYFRALCEMEAGSLGFATLQIYVDTVDQGLVYVEQV